MSKKSSKEQEKGNTGKELKERKKDSVKKEGAKKSDENRSEAETEEINLAKELIGMVIYILFVILAVWFIVHFVGQRTEVSGESMYDTLDDGDNLWVDKLSYRFKDPKRFDIVVFPYQDSSVYYIKRIIGLPGDWIRIDDEGTIYINNEPLDEDYGYETIDPSMIGRADHNIVLGEDEYFVMGDNRNNSIDSRFVDVGPVKKKNIDGHAVLRICSFKNKKDGERGSVNFSTFGTLK